MRWIVIPLLAWLPPVAVLLVPLAHCSWPPFFVVVPVLLVLGIWSLMRIWRSWFGKWRSARNTIRAAASAAVTLMAIPAYLVIDEKGYAAHYDSVVRTYAAITPGMTEGEIARLLRGYDSQSIVQTGSSDGATHTMQRVGVRLVCHKDEDWIDVFYENRRVVGKRLAWVSDPYPEEDFPTVLPPEYR